MIENGLKDLVQGYSADRLPSSDADVVALHYWCVMVTYYAVQLFKDRIDIFDSETLYTIRDIYFVNIITEIRREGNRLILKFPELCDEKYEVALKKMFEKLEEEGLNGPIPWIDDLYICVEFE